MDKPALRRTLLAARATMGPAARAQQDARRTGLLLSALQARRSPIRCLTSYVSVGTEPNTSALHAALADAGVRVLLPRVRPDGGLDFVADEGDRVPGPDGIPVPPGAAVDPTLADCWLVPALAVDRRGHRLGRGGGAYDRVLPAVRPVLALLFAGELVDELPAEPHDRPVTHVALPAGVTAVGG